MKQKFAGKNAYYKYFKKSGTIDFAILINVEISRNLAEADGEPR